MGDVKNLEERFWEKVRKTDACWLWTASTDSHGYGQLKSGAKMLGVHRLSWELANGPIPSGLMVDHRPTCSKRCVNPSHLRLATNKQNSENRSGAQRNSKTGFRGVSPLRGKYQAQVTHNKKNIYIGVFDTPGEAAVAAAAKRLELFTHSDADMPEGGQAWIQ